MFAEELFIEIQSVWESERRRCNAEIIECPSLVDLRAIVETAFFASLKKEEGNEISFSLALITEQQIDNTPSGHPEHNHQVKMEFPEPLPLNVETISKLAKAFDKNCTALAVELSNENGATYQIWGAIYFEKSFLDPINFEVTTFAGHGFYTIKPDCLIVKTSSPGSLSISFGGHNMGYFENGKFTQSVPTPFSKGAIQPYIERVFRGNRNFDIKDWHLYIQSLKKILFEISQRGEGGTVIFVPPSKVTETSSFFNKIYSFPGGLGVNFLLNETIKARNEHSDLYSQMMTILGRRLESFAQLSRIDGALIITSEWEVIAFGAKLTASKWNGNVTIGPNAYNFPIRDTQFDRTKFGTRHNSAIDFVGSCSDVIAFVISEDGPIRGFVKQDENTILCWKDLRVAVVV